MHVPATLLIIFNRPAPTRRVLDALRKVRPERLYVAADGPRPADRHPDDPQRVAQARAQLDAVDWPCKLQTHFHDRNMGCARGVAEAVAWFFSHESEGLILEDDCLPHPDFFRWGKLMLERHRDDRRVMHVNGCNLMAPESCFGGADCAYMSFPLVWGWASWARAWKTYELSPRLEDLPPLASLCRPGFPFFYAAAHRARIADAVMRLHTWDYQWSLAVLRCGGLCPTPRSNLISNIGFGAEATHTLGRDDPLAALGVCALPDHPVIPQASSSYLLNRYFAERQYGKPFRIWKRHCTSRLLHVLGARR